MNEKLPIIAHEWWTEYWPLVMGASLVVAFICIIITVVVANRVEIEMLDARITRVAAQSYTINQSNTNRALFVGRLEADESRIEYLERLPVVKQNK